MKTSGIILLCLLGATTANADFIGYGNRNCQSNGWETRGKLGDKEVCIVEIQCEKYRLLNHKEYNVVNLKAYCKPTEENTCPDAQTCHDDDSITIEDLDNIVEDKDGPSSRTRCNDRKSGPSAGSGSRERIQRNGTGG